MNLRQPLLFPATDTPTPCFLGPIRIPRQRLSQSAREGAPSLLGSTAGGQARMRLWAAPTVPRQLRQGVGIRVGTLADRESKALIKKF